MRATASLVLSYRIDAGTPPKNANAATCPAQNASVVSAGYACTKPASLCGRSIAKKWIFRSPRRLARSAPRGFEAPQGSRDPVVGHRPFAYRRRIMADSPCQEKYESTSGLINKRQLV